MSETIQVNVDDEVIMLDDLKLADRCDRCNSQAFVQALIVLDAPPLLFCGHHFADNEDALSKVAITIKDERHRINEKPNEEVDSDD